MGDYAYAHQKYYLFIRGQLLTIMHCRCMLNLLILSLYVGPNISVVVCEVIHVIVLDDMCSISLHCAVSYIIIM